MAINNCPNKYKSCDFPLLLCLNQFSRMMQVRAESGRLEGDWDFALPSVGDVHPKNEGFTAYLQFIALKEW